MMMHTNIPAKHAIQLEEEKEVDAHAHTHTHTHTLTHTHAIITVPFFVVWSVVNSVAWYHGSTQALPFTTIVLLMFIWLIGAEFFCCFF